MRKVKVILWIMLLFSSPYLFGQATAEIGFKGSIINGEYLGGLKDGVPFTKNQIVKRNYLVNTKAELIDALQKAKSGQVVYVEDNASIDLSGSMKIIIPAGVTLASGRGKNGSRGGLLYSNKNGTKPLFTIGGANVSIVGLRIKGPDTEIYANGKDAFAGKSNEEKKKNRLQLYKQNMYGVPVSEGILNGCANFEVRNCEIYGWTHAGIVIVDGGDGSRIFNNYIHHNQRFGLGYGVVVDGAKAIIKGNLFDYNRHSVAGTGRMGSSYEVSYNKFLENNNTTWAIDMHGGADRKDGSNLAGSNLVVHNNIIRLKGSALAVVVRGVPSDDAKIYNNDITYVDRKKNSKKALATQKNTTASVQSNISVDCIQQRNAKGKFSAFNNRVNRD
uniref:Right handed beta helix domain-containing protein n=1 Tax=Sphingobacterium sp. (strain 21) TaxID=743722 RepID=F4C961_SPHS2